MEGTDSHRLDQVEDDTEADAGEGRNDQPVEGDTEADVDAGRHDQAVEADMEEEDEQWSAT